jgi:glutaredoxin
MKVKVFWKRDCPNCPKAKELGKKLEADGASVEYYDVETSGGLAEAALLGVMTTPSVAVTRGDGAEVRVWRGEAPSLDEVKKTLEKA